ncbi:hypothetical protein ERJ75_001114900 [Trypanosoma vivax]|nr:hypothetical protein ERJ75_001114900 [Trypanosoma vivax]
MQFKSTLLAEVVRLRGLESNVVRATGSVKGFMEKAASVTKWVEHSAVCAFVANAIRFLEETNAIFAEKKKNINETESLINRISVSIEMGWRLLSGSVAAVVNGGGLEGSHNYATWEQSMDSRVSTKLYHELQLMNVSDAVEKQLASVEEEGTAWSSSTEAA